MQINKQKIYEIIITALISAGIAFLQSLASAHFFKVGVSETTATAGILGGLIRACRV